MYGSWGPAYIQYLHSYTVTVTYSFTLFPLCLSPVHPSCSCLLKNMEGKCQVCHFSLSHPPSSITPASPSYSCLYLSIFLPIRLVFHVQFVLQFTDFRLFLYCSLYVSYYLSSLFIFPSPSVFIFFLVHAQFVLLLIITSLSFLSPFICHLHYVLISLPSPSPPLPLLMYLLLNLGNSHTLFIFLCLAILFFFLHMKLSLTPARSFSFGRPICFEPQRTTLQMSFFSPFFFFIGKAEIQRETRAHCLYHITSVQCDTERQIIGRSRQI